MNQDYDLVILGTGTAASGTAMRVRAAGQRVAIVDCRPFGGTCALRGCDPKKMMVGGAAAFDHARRMRGSGVEGEVRLDWPGLMRFKRSFTEPVPAKNEQRFRDKGIDAFRGQARFTGPNTIEVDGQALQGRHILIAVGAEPAPLHVPGAEHVIDNEGFLQLDALPPRIVLVGGGYIAAEFSHIAARAGAQVTIVQQGDRILKGFDADLVGWLMQAFESQRIDVRLNTKVESIERAGAGYRVKATTAGQELLLEADLVVHAAGRVPALQALNLAAAGVAVDGRGRLQLNDYLQSTSNPAVYAAGDAAQVGPPLTPVASQDAKVVSANLLEGNHRKPDYRGVPSVAFTIPPIAMVGLSEAQAREQELRFKVNSRKASDWFTARQAAEPTYGFKVLVEEGSGRILGAHLVGPHADEVVNLFALAIRHGLSAEDLKGTMFAYPSAASDIGYML
ncbi:MAG: NAD(P)/FAD-dependent oxidoreductase [Ramlibacter sp.]|nr:NAD(P)/FAD-dependent oxidoreductase [Ramlibacter sp.]